MYRHRGPCIAAKHKQGGFLIGTNRLNPTSAKGINTVLVDADGWRFELQYHTPESYRVKDGEMHVLYECLRLLTDQTTPEALGIVARMWELSGKIKVPSRIMEVGNR